MYGTFFSISGFPSKLALFIHYSYTHGNFEKKFLKLIRHINKSNSRLKGIEEGRILLEKLKNEEIK